MKRVLLFTLAVLLFNISGVISQVVGTGFQSGSTVQSRLTVYNILPPFEEKIDIQKMFEKQEWIPARISFKSGRPDMRVKAIFDKYEGDLYYFENNKIMEFVDPVSEFLLRVPYKSDSLNFLFRRFFPSIEKNTESTFYRVIVHGRFQLLCCEEKSIELVRDQSVLEGKIKKHQAKAYFAYTPDNKMHLISLDEGRLKKELSAYQQIIEKILHGKKLKIRNESQLVDLFIDLNNYNE
ncbi:MAG TPA: hypothetical protein P5158_04105 [Chitinophagaceae bacterium]|nr:hypothetical protein [Chitinophagaceae bacterium]